MGKIREVEKEIYREKCQGAEERAIGVGGGVVFWLSQPMKLLMWSRQGAGQPELEHSFPSRIQSTREGLCPDLNYIQVLLSSPSVLLYLEEVTALDSVWGLSPALQTIKIKTPQRNTP